MKIVSVQSIPNTPISHDTNLSKKVLLSRPEVENTGLMQLAITRIPASQEITKHVHKDMIEVFYVMQGKGIVIINKREFPIEEGTMIKVDFGEDHAIIALEELVLIYFGVV